MIGNWLTDKEINNLIFRNRNKEYGAYDLRIRYNPSVIKSLIIAIILIVFPVYSYYFYYMFVENSELEEMLKANYSGLSNKDLKYIFQAPPPPPPKATLPKSKINKINNLIEKKNEPLALILPDTTKIKADTLSIAQKEKLKLDTISEKSKKWYFEVEKLPEYPGGEEELTKFITKNLKYPYLSYLNKVQGIVIVQFRVSSLGKIDSVAIAQSIDYLLDYEAARVVKSMPAWKPGLIKGKPVNVICILPLQFKL